MALGIACSTIQKKQHPMRKLISSLYLVLFVSGSTGTLMAQEPATKAPHHVMYTTVKGKNKCCNKGSKAKADKCTEKPRSKQATAVQVMAGK